MPKFFSRLVNMHYFGERTVKARTSSYEFVGQGLSAGGTNSDGFNNDLAFFFRDEKGYACYKTEAFSNILGDRDLSFLADFCIIDSHKTPPS